MSAPFTARDIAAHGQPRGGVSRADLCSALHEIGLRLSAREIDDLVKCFSKHSSTDRRAAASGAVDDPLDGEALITTAPLVRALCDAYQGGRSGRERASPQDGAREKVCLVPLGGHSLYFTR